MGIFSFKQNNIWFPLGVFFPPSSACFWIIQKASSWKNFSAGSYYFLLQVKEKVHDVKSEHQDFVNV